MPDIQFKSETERPKGDESTSFIVQRVLRNVPFISDKKQGQKVVVVFVAVVIIISIALFVNATSGPGGSPGHQTEDNTSLPQEI
ncbi:MAG: hypothetical protein BRC25_00025 [Parcubacteria group bacterium SW_6_46_9]|nr:MAG: hypothetical protein BRC25_00025 [Parcubacteria group bacterium SW_6_46_9]